jgi:cell division protein FtsB
LNWKKSKFWKIPVILLCGLIGIVAWLGYGQQGLINLYRTEMEREAYIDRIRQLAEENRALLKEIERLRSDMKYVESVARRQLNLIKEDEVIYRFEKKEEGSVDLRRTADPGGKQGDRTKERKKNGSGGGHRTGFLNQNENTRPEKEVFRSGETR